MFYLKQSTASQAVIIGPFIDEDDGKTTEEALTIANTDIRLSKNGANMVDKNSGGGTHDEAGWYAITLDATDTDTVGRLQVSVHVAGALPVWMEFQVVEEDTYEFFYASGATPDTDIAAILEDTGTTIPGTITTLQADTDDIQTRLPAALVGGAMDSDVSNMQANTVTASALATDAAEEIADQVWDELIAGHVGVGSFGEEVQAHAQPGDAMALTAGAVDDVWDELQAGHVTASSFGVFLDATITSRSDFDETADPVELLDTGGAAGTSASELVDDMWDEAKAGHVGAGSFGEEVQLHSLSTEISALNDLSAADVNAEVDTALADARLDELISATAGGTDATIGSFLDLIMNADGGQTFSQATDSLEALAGASAPSAADIADAVWDELIAGHVGAGSFGEEVQAHATSAEIAALNDLAVTDILADSIAFNGANIDAAITSRSVAGDAMALTAAAVDAIWDELQAGHVGAGSFGLFLDSAISGRAAAGDAMDLIAGAIVAGTFGAGAIDAAALATDAGQEIADRILLRSLATGADGGRTVQEALRLLRNRRAVAGGTLTVFEEDDVTPDWTAAVTTAAGDPVDEIDPA